MQLASVEMSDPKAFESVRLFALNYLPSAGLPLTKQSRKRNRSSFSYSLSTQLYMVFASTGAQRLVIPTMRRKKGSLLN